MSESKKQVLIIDDEETIVELLKVRLEDKGYEVLSAGDGLTGLEMIKKHKPNLIIMDVLMPKMTGYEVINNLKATDKKLINIPIIIISAKHAMSQFFDRWDISAFIPKPFDSKTLIDTIDNIVAGQDNSASKSGIRKREKPVLLVVSVQEYLYKKIKEHFEEQGLIVEKALDEKDLLVEAKKTHPDIIASEYFEDPRVLDTNKIYKALHAHERLRNIPFVAFAPQALGIDAQKEIPSEKVLTFSSTQELCQKLTPAINAIKKKKLLQV